MAPTRVFIHGLESSSQGTKGMFFRARFPDVIMEDYSGWFQQRMEQLETLLTGKNELILVGSSYGGLMAASYACLHEERLKKLILLAPALHLDAYKPYRSKILHIPVDIFHGRRDEVVPLTTVQQIAQQVYADCTFEVLEDDHSLHDTFPLLDWDTLLLYR
jgi:pimeloyl-ACP methyl ester carboxylesterase